MRERSLAAVLGALVPFLRPYLPRIALALGCLVVAKFANLGVPLVLKALVDRLDVTPADGGAEDGGQAEHQQVLRDR